MDTWICGAIVYFNPLAPRGARLVILSGLLTDGHFNPLAPRGARHFLAAHGHAISSNFNPLAPRGARQ